MTFRPPYHRTVLHACLLAALATVHGAGWATAPGYENLDTVTLPDGQYFYVGDGKAYSLNHWTFVVIDSNGAVDPESNVVVTNQMVNTGLADNATDKAMVMDGRAASSALVLKSASGEKFQFHGITVEQGISNWQDYILQGYRDGVAVTGAEKSFTAPLQGGNGMAVSVSGKPWSYVDEIRFVLASGSGPGYLSLWVDDINVSSAITPVTVTSVSFSADSGTSSTDLITNIPAQTLSGNLSANLPAGETVQVSIDNGATWQDATASVGSSAWQLSGVTLTGSNTFKARLTDAQNYSGPEFSAPYVYDTSGPTITFSGLALSSDTGESSNDFITKVASQTVTAMLSAAPAASDRVYGSLDNGSTWTDLTGSVSGATLTWTGITLLGSNTLQLRVDDAAGNPGSVTSRAYVLDATAPAAPSAPALLAASDLGISNSDRLTSLATPTLAGTAEAGSTVTVYDGATLLDSTVATGGVWSYTTSTRTHGLHTFSATATDLAGNVSAASAGVGVSIDTIAPQVSSVVVPPSATYYGGNNLDLTVKDVLNNSNA